MSKDSRPDHAPETQQSKEIPKGKRHPLFGALKGFTHIPQGVDLTEPADPDWGKVYDQPDDAD